MIAGLKPYPAMKDSGVPWLGKVPDSWEVRRLKNICRLAYGDALAADVRIEGAIPVLGSNGQVGFHTVPNTKSPRVVVGRKGSFGKVNYSAQPVFAIDTTFFVDDRYTNADLRWLFYVIGWLRLDEVSKDSAVPGLGREDAYQAVAPLPPHREQTAIVRFLDHADRRIRRYIYAKQKLIKLVEEQKQAIVNRAVTRGLDPSVRLKPSGVEWLGDVPEHWQVTRFRTVLAERLRNGLYKSREHYGDGSILMVQMGEAFASAVIEQRAVDRVRLTPDEIEAFGLSQGDLLFARRSIVFEGSGKCSIVGRLPEPHVFESSMIRVRPESSPSSRRVSFSVLPVELFS